VPTPREITEPLPGGEVEYVDARPTPYRLRVVEHDPSWAARYGELEATVREALGERVLGIQHVGSTSVPGLPAKPIIDIDLTVADPADEDSYVPPLQATGFLLWLREPDWHQHRLLKLLDEPQVHLHVYGEGCPEVVRTRMFRDWLIAHPDDRERYAAAKRQALAELEASGADPEALDHGMRYNRIKEPVVHEIQERMFRAAGLLD